MCLVGNTLPFTSYQQSHIWRQCLIRARRKLFWKQKWKVTAQGRKSKNWRRKNWETVPDAHTPDAPYKVDTNENQWIAQGAHLMHSGELNGKETQKRGVCVWPIHFAMQVQLKQHCKATIKINFKDNIISREKKTLIPGLNLTWSKHWLMENVKKQIENAQEQGWQSWKGMGSERRNSLHA